MLRILCLAAVACSSSKQPEGTPAEAPAKPKLTTEMAERLAKDFAKQMFPCNATEIRSFFDADLLAKRVATARKLDDARQRQIRAALTSQFGDLCPLLTGVVPDKETKGSYTLLRVRQVDGRPRPLLRLVTADSFNYHELDLELVGDRVQIADVYVFASGKLSDSLAFYVHDVASNAADERAFKQIGEHVVAGKYREARAALAALPEKLRTLKMMMIYDLTIAGSSGDSSDYVKALDAFAVAFPDDPALEIMRISQATNHKRYAEAIAQIERLDKRVGGDPYLDAERANIYLMARNFPDALQHAKRATEQAPELLDGWEALLDTHIASKNFADAVKTLADMRTRKVPFDPKADAYRALVESQEYKAWLKANPL